MAIIASRNVASGCPCHSLVSQREKRHLSADFPLAAFRQINTKSEATVVVPTFLESQASDTPGKLTNRLVCLIDPANTVRVRRSHQQGFIPMLDSCSPRKHFI